MAPEDLWLNYQYFVLGDKSEGWGVLHGEVVDIAILAPMLRYVGLKWVRDSAAHVYTCMWVGADGRCANYEGRPEMCRIYTSCEYPNCESTWCKAHRASQSQ